LQGGAALDRLLEAKQVLANEFGAAH
jgi:hypothetical protein